MPEFIWQKLKHKNSAIFAVILLPMSTFHAAVILRISFVDN